ncbi:MAG: hypothetical protein Q4D66_01445 [Bacteroidales bacterium]|nr:hypothetical protein [Bacteroidales bacterium]
MNARLHRYFKGMLSHAEEQQWREELAAQEKRRPEEEALLLMLSKPVAFEEQWESEEGCIAFEELLQGKEYSAAPLPTLSKSSEVTAAGTFPVSSSSIRRRWRLVPIRWTAVASVVLLFMLATWWAMPLEKESTRAPIAHSPNRSVVASSRTRTAPSNELASTALSLPSAANAQKASLLATQEELSSPRGQISPRVATSATIDVAAVAPAKSSLAPAEAEFSELEQAYRLHQQEKLYFQLLLEAEYQRYRTVQDSLAADMITSL